MTSPVPELLREDGLPQAAELLADAFFDNPLHVYICPDPRSRTAKLRWLLEANLRQQDLSQSFCLRSDGGVDAMGFWIRTDWRPPGLRRMLSAGLLAAPFRLGPGVLRRAFEVSERIESQLHRALGDRTAWYLNNMAVRGELRGRGVGGELLSGQIDRLQSMSTRLLALATQREENVVFYGRLGFEVTSEELFGGVNGSFRNWIMERSIHG